MALHINLFILAWVFLLSFISTKALDLELFKTKRLFQKDFYSGPSLIRIHWSLYGENVVQSDLSPVRFPFVEKKGKQVYLFFRTYLHFSFLLPIMCFIRGTCCDWRCYNFSITKAKMIRKRTVSNTELLLVKRHWSRLGFMKREPLNFSEFNISNKYVWAYVYSGLTLTTKRVQNKAKNIE